MILNLGQLINHCVNIGMRYGFDQVPVFNNPQEPREVGFYVPNEIGFISLLDPQLQELIENQVWVREHSLTTTSLEKEIEKYYHLKKS